MPPVIKKKAKPAKKAISEGEPEVVSAQLQKKINEQKSRKKLRGGVVFIKHLPHGFFEDQLQNYFEQFGTVTRLRLARSKLTGGTKGYAYVEFKYPEVAEVAAETMDNYLMFNKLVKAIYIPPEKQLSYFFKTSVRQVKNNAGKPIYISAKTAAINRQVKRFNDSSEETYQKRTARKLKKIEKLNKKYAHLGIDFTRIVVGAKKIGENLENSVAEPTGNTAVQTKSGKLKNESAEKSSKKSKKAPELKDLLGETLNEDSDDEDYVAEALSGDENETDEENSNNSLDVEELVGATLNDGSDGDDGWHEEGGIESGESEEEVSVQMTDSKEDDDEDEDDEENKPPQKKPKKIGKGNLVKANPKKEDHLDKLIKHKKHMGGIQKVRKVQSKKPKIAKAKNTMHTALTKQMAQPLPLMKNKIKTSKNQKK